MQSWEAISDMAMGGTLPVDAALIATCPDGNSARCVCA